MGLEDLPIDESLLEARWMDSGESCRQGCQGRHSAPFTLTVDWLDRVRHVQPSPFLCSGLSPDLQYLHLIYKGGNQGNQGKDAKEHGMLCNGN